MEFKFWHHYIVVVWLGPVASKVVIMLIRPYKVVKWNNEWKLLAQFLLYSKYANKVNHYSYSHFCP